MYSNLMFLKLCIMKKPVINFIPGFDLPKIKIEPVVSNFVIKRQKEEIPKKPKK